MPRTVYRAFVLSTSIHGRMLNSLAIACTCSQASMILWRRILTPYQVLYSKCVHSTYLLLLTSAPSQLLDVELYGPHSKSN